MNLANKQCLVCCMCGVQCGRPAVTDLCKDCGATIGGVNHAHAEGNRAADAGWVTYVCLTAMCLMCLVTLVEQFNCIPILCWRGSSDDATKTGHCLGPAAQQQRHHVTGERQLTPTSTALVRCLLHAAMLLGAESNIRVRRCVWLSDTL